MTNKITGDSCRLREIQFASQCMECHAFGRCTHSESVLSIKVLGCEKVLMCSCI